MKNYLSAVVLIIAVIFGFIVFDKQNGYFDKLLRAIDSEKEYFKKNPADSFNLPKAFVRLEEYRKTLKVYADHEGISLDFDSAFLIEHFDIYKHEKRVYYYSITDYRTIIYLKKNGANYFYDINISPDLQKVKILNICLKEDTSDILDAWLAKPFNYARLNRKNRFINHEKENYLVISKYTQNKSFCRIEFNPMWSLMMMQDHSNKQSKTAWALEEIAGLYCLTGNGGPY